MTVGETKTFDKTIEDVWFEPNGEDTDIVYEITILEILSRDLPEASPSNTLHRSSSNPSVACQASPYTVSDFGLNTFPENYTIKMKAVQPDLCGMDPLITFALSGVALLRPAWTSSSTSTAERA
jgi:hypothetical protein